MTEILKIFEEYNSYMLDIPIEYKTDKEKVDDYRLKCMSNDFNLQSHQLMLSRLMQPSSPYNGLLVFHQPGTGKTLVSISIAQEFYHQIAQYDTRIMVLLPGPGIEESFRQQLLESEYRYRYGSDVIGNIKKKTAEEIASERKNILKDIRSKFEILTQRTFSRRVVGDKMTTTSGDLIRDDQGVVQRNKSAKRFSSLQNTLLIVDEAHNMTNETDIWLALHKVITHKYTKNVKVVLLTATPMKNKATDIVRLLNLILPHCDSLKHRYPEMKEKYKNEKCSPNCHQIEEQYIFENRLGKVDDITLAPKWFEYLQKHVAPHHISFLQADPVIFATSRFIGDKLDGFDYNVFRCPMSKFQQASYDEVEQNYRSEDKTDAILNAFDRDFQQAMMFSFPILNRETKQIVHTNDINAIQTNQEIMTNRGDLNAWKEGIKKLCNYDQKIQDFMTISRDGTISGSFLKQPYLETFSSKFNALINNLQKPGKAFIYSELVKGVGLKLLAETLKMNGFIQYSSDIYSSDGNYNEKIYRNVRCYKCRKYMSEHSADARADLRTKPSHPFHPATFSLHTGNTVDLSSDGVVIDEKEVVLELFNKAENLEGKFVSIIIGSRVLREGRNLFELSSVHVMEAQYNLAVMQQIFGRGLRHCSHKLSTSYENPNPEVIIFLYCCSLMKNKKGISNEEEKYIKAGKKYELVRIVENGLKQLAGDCALTYNKNCAHKSCNWTCLDPVLNKKYYDESTGYYRSIDTSGTQILGNKNEINFIIRNIQQLFYEKLLNDIPYATLNEIMTTIRSKYLIRNYKLYSEKNAYIAIRKMWFKTPNDRFIGIQNQYIIYDPFGQAGYLVQKGSLYFWQPMSTNEQLSVRNRTIPLTNLDYDISINDYVDNLLKPNHIKYIYDKSYYDRRDESTTFVGILIYHEKTSEWRLNIRKGVNFLKTKHRAKGQDTENGQYYKTKSIEDLDNICNALGITFKSINRSEYGPVLLNRLIELETNDKNNVTHLIIPSNHPTLKFPLNRSG